MLTFFKSWLVRGGNIANVEGIEGVDIVVRMREIEFEVNGGNRVQDELEGGGLDRIRFNVVVKLDPVTPNCAN